MKTPTPSLPRDRRFGDVRYFVCRQRGALGAPTQVVTARDAEHFAQMFGEQLEPLGSFDDLMAATRFYFDNGGEG